MPRLYHVSETGNIARFDPQPAPNNPDAEGKVVWAIDDAHLVNYLLPRDCPRVCFVESGRHIVAAEKGWLDRIKSTTLFVYEFSDASFELQDAIAGYWVSKQTAIPISQRVVKNVVPELELRGAELRVFEHLWALHDNVALSSCEFSMIRMRNALPRV